ncbi:glycosyltransferase family 2 protein [Actinotalea ferrariae]|uniref:glycosyltransferase family 2 protein n=1 Tax=Actinotalea ferrariae TaxID=1386098 RepID=UPI001C8B8830|nr:glycosyltransferase family 2 protein [Actinotalea ferrariae]MBX9243467.1 glycosyltransferase family 2 protein [Actinotalea ferrariae]
MTRTDGATPAGRPGDPRVLVVVPAWNEEDTLPAVITEIRSSVQGADVLVVNDGSTDATARVADAAGAAVLDLPINLGVGGAMRAGYKYALRNGYDVALQVDADGQHDPAEIPRMLELLRTEDLDIVIGARFAGQGSYEARGPRRWAMRVLSVTLSRVTGTRLTDTTSGFKACGPRAIRLFAANYPAEYLGDTVESLVIASRARLAIRQLPVTMRPRAGGRPSHNPVKAAFFLLRAVLALVIALSRPTQPLPTGVDR